MVGTLQLVVLFDLLSGIIAMLVSYYAFRARRLVESSILNAVSLGFMLLGAALLVEVVITLSLGLTAGDVSRLRVVELLENLAYLFLQVVAFAIIAFGYARTTYGGRAVVASVQPGVAALATAVARPRLVGLALTLFYLFLGLEFAVLFALVFIMFQGFLVYSRSRDGSSLLVLLGFALMFVAHLVVLRSLLDVSGVEYLVAAGIQFLGFLSLLAFVIRSGRVGST